MRVNPQLKRLVDAAWDCFDSARQPCVVRPSIPILFFGDLVAYSASPLRVVTVGLNPSREEFPADGPMSRFPPAEGLTAERARTDEGAEAYVGALDAYFTTRPYSRWFEGAFGSLLAGAGASYGPGPCVALHTDLCSPIATDPTWSGLSPGEREPLMRAGVPLWHDLLAHLQPDLVLVSVARHHLSRIAFPALTPWTETFRVERANPYGVEASWRAPTEGKRSLFAFGKAAQMPFGTLGASDKRAVGARLAEMARA